MTSGFRTLLVFVVLGILPIAVYAQAFGQGQVTAQDQRAAPLGLAAQPGAGAALVAPTVGNTLQQRQPRAGVPGTQPGAPGAPATLGPQSLPFESLPPAERIEFQDFVAQAFGRDLPIFGAELFKNVPTTFAPVDNIPVTADYAIGPGDEILIRAWGQVDVDFPAVVDRTGTINIPKVGTVNVAGIKYQDLHAHLKTAIGRVFRNFELSVSLGQLRAIQVYVVGQARRPGSYTVSSMSTLVNAIFAAGGPSTKGSMRGIQLKRGNKVVTELDLYDLLISGDKSKDVPLLPGDVIFFPPVGSMVAISGSVNVAAIFELRKDGSLGELITWAGGLSSTAAGQKATVERIDERKARRVDEFRLDEAGMRANLRNGDMVTIYAVASRIDNAVSLRGNVAQPARFPWREGLRITDLIPRVDSLMSRQYWLRKNQTIGLDNTIAELLKRNQAAGVDIPVADLLRKNQQSQQQEMDATLADAMRRTQIAADVATASADSLKKIAPVQSGLPGQVGVPAQVVGGVTQAAALARPGSTGLGSTGLGIGQGAQAGGQENSSRIKLADEIKRNLDEVNWNYAVIERLNPRDLTTTLVPFNLGKAILEGDASQNLLLQPGDVVTIFSVDDIQSPVAKQTKYVRLEGEFVNAGVYRVEPGETLRQLILRVGGLTPNAYLFGAEFTRESNRVFQQKKLEESINRLERQVQAAGLYRAKNVTSAEEAAGLNQDAVAQQTLIAKMRQIKASGRIVLEIPPKDAAGLIDLPELALEDSDRLVVPSRPSVVNVIGAVYNENSFIFKSGKRLPDYLNQAGGVSLTGNKNDVYLLRVDGSVQSKRESGWLTSSLDGQSLMPGDTIVVPEDFDRTTWTKSIKDWTQIMYQFALGAAAVKVLK